MKLSEYAVWAELDGRVGVFSGLTGGFMVMTEDQRAEVEAFVDGATPTPDQVPLLERLVRMRALCTSEFDERAELRRRYDASRWHSETLGFTIVTSLGCNFHCGYCFEDKRPALLRLEVADAIVRVLRDSLPWMSGLAVTWMGGEPLLGRRQLFALSDRFIELCAENGKQYNASIITNGWYLDAETAHGLRARGVNSAQVTMDGPPDVHNRNRPHISEAPTFDRILANVVACASILDIVIRVNVDTGNADRVDELLQLLASAGLADRVRVRLARLTDATSNAAAPVASYQGRCMSAPDFARLEVLFNRRAESYGFAPAPLPGPRGTPCAAVRSHDVIVGAHGEMWKCWDDIGDASQTIGTIFDYRNTNSNLVRWLQYHPLDDPQCSACVALPVCMGGCVHHDFTSDDREARCGTFRHGHEEQVREALRRAIGLPAEPVSLSDVGGTCATRPPPLAAPVVFTRRRPTPNEPRVLPV